jgi:uncharacterized protein YdeI (YjbR/CyaY-like superfamily)
MAQVIPDPKKIKSFRSAAEFERWLSKHHDSEDELWLRAYKKGSGQPTVTIAEALDIVLCWGWIDGLRKSYDENSFLQRYSPRKAKSVWSDINRDNVARLTKAGRMTPHGQKHIDAAKADGRWDAAYAPIRSASEESIPKDLRAAIDGNPRALKTFKQLNRQNLFALIFRTNNMKTPAGRARKIETLVAMLARGETVVPQRLAKKPAAKRSGRKSAQRPPSK